MTHVVTLIGPSNALDASTLKRVSKELPGVVEPQPLGPGAVDISFNPSADADQRAYSQKALAAHLRGVVNGPIDIVVQPAANRRKRLFLADMDSTMIGQECIDELAAFVGLKEHVAAITERAMRGEIDFEPALRERVALLKGLSVGVVDEVIEKHITLTPGGSTLVRTMRKHGAYTALVSGGFTLFTNRIARMIGFDETRANTLTLNGETLAGAVDEPIFGRETKRATLIELRKRLGITDIETMATGDGANDLDMIAEAGLGVAYHAKPKVAEAAAARIDHGDLTALLYLQGYRDEEFA